MNKAVFYSLLALFCSNGFADPLGEGAFDTINISADEAVEDEIPGIIHLKGNFQMLSDEWSLTSNLATVNGSPNKPDRIYLQGSPARFLFLPEKDTSKEQYGGDIIRHGHRLATARASSQADHDLRLKTEGHTELLLLNEQLLEA